MGTYDAARFLVSTDNRLGEPFTLRLRVRCRRHELRRVHSQDESEGRSNGRSEESKREKHCNYWYAGEQGDSLEERMQQIGGFIDVQSINILSISLWVSEDTAGIQ